MSSARDWLKQQRVLEATVPVRDRTFRVVGLERVAKGDLQESCRSSKGKLNGTMYEGKLLAACVLDETGEPVAPDWREWNVPSDVSGPLIAAIIKLCGLDEDEQIELSKKNCETTET